MITDDAGNVALSYYQNTNKVVTIGSTTYIFRVQRNVNLAWIQPEHVETILAMKKTCCGGRSNGVFRYTTEQQLRVWNGAER